MEQGGDGEDQTVSIAWRTASGPAELPARPPAGYRVEHRTAAGATVLAEDIECLPHHSSLVAWTSRLTLARIVEGQVVLIDPATERVVARRGITTERRRNPR